MTCDKGLPLALTGVRSPLGLTLEGALISASKPFSTNRCSNARSARSSDDSGTESGRTSTSVPSSSRALSGKTTTLFLTTPRYVVLANASPLRGPARPRWTAGRQARPRPAAGIRLLARVRAIRRPSPRRRLRRCCPQLQLLGNAPPPRSRSAESPIVAASPQGGFVAVARSFSCWATPHRPAPVRSNRWPNPAPHPGGYRARSCGGGCRGAEPPPTDDPGFFAAGRCGDILA